MKRSPLRRKTPMKKEAKVFGKSISQLRKLYDTSSMRPHPTLPNTLVNDHGTVIETRSKKVADWLTANSSGLVQKASSFTAKKKPMSKIGASPLKKLDAELVKLFSRMVRMKAMNYEGYINCYICDAPVHWREAECMHFQGRVNKATRFVESANKAGCHECNSKPLGDRLNFAKKLDEQYGAGHSEMLTILSKQELKMDREAYRYAIEYCESEIKKAMA